MPLSELRLQDLRCLPAAELQLHPRINLITGENGTGKTTLLEAVYLLGRGRSFRTRQVAQLIRQGQPSCWVAGRVAALAVGAGTSLPIDSLTDASGALVSTSTATSTTPQRRVDVTCDPGEVRARIDGQAVQSLAELSHLLPVQVIDPGIHRLVEEGPALRRRWLDWAVFHVEPGFMLQWQGYMRALRQRNAALRSGGNPLPWETELVRLGEALTRARETVMSELRPVWDGTVADLGAATTTLQLSRGWSRDETLAEALMRHRERDRERGLTGQGPHRCDVVLRVDGRPAREVVSRGQQKVLGAAMALAVMRYLAARRGTVPMLLLDDPAAELDATHTQALLRLAGALGGQCVVTALHPEMLAAAPADRVFHVERGGVKQL
ncbi:MAG TPA: DNA replication/repair protein RecF [Steroidobacteraceae bacterium]|nr:DNA replication/repair protein RecF [Steroidobacteraceae bacterium]